MNFKKTRYTWYCHIAKTILRVGNRYGVKEGEGGNDVLTANSITTVKDHFFPVMRAVSTSAVCLFCAHPSKL